jgi:hypothetical protein
VGLFLARRDLLGWCSWVSVLLKIEEGALSCSEGLTYERCVGTMFFAISDLLRTAYAAVECVERLKSVAGSRLQDLVLRTRRGTRCGSATHLDHSRFWFLEIRGRVWHIDTISGYAVSCVSSSSSHYRRSVPYSKSPISLLSSALRCFPDVGRPRTWVEFPYRSTYRDVVLGEAVRSTEVVVEGRERAGVPAKGFGGSVGEEDGNGASSVWCGMASAGWGEIAIGMVSSGERSNARGVGVEEKCAYVVCFLGAASSPELELLDEKGH